MLTTTHYGLNVVEGTDVVNPLVQQNPNYTAIDAAMYANKQGSIGSGTELTAGTVHTITRANQDSNYVRFTATSNWTAGDSMIIDSTPVSVFLSDGTVPATGAYIINTEVLLILNGTRVTLIVSDGKQDADDVFFDNTGTGLIANDVEDAIKELDANATAITTQTVALSSPFIGSVTFTKIGRVVSVVGTINVSTAQPAPSDFTKIIDIPAAYKPAMNVNTSCPDFRGTSVPICVRASIASELLYFSRFAFTTPEEYRFQLVYFS